MEDRVYRFKDLTGKRFGRLTVMNISHKDDRRCYHWLCQCACGTQKVANGRSLRGGGINSCGCLHREFNMKAKTTHGEYGSRLYYIWTGMTQRVTNRKNCNYSNYGGRGISICNEWLKYENFRDWSLKNGYSDKLTIDRIDNNGDYTPGNCRWITQKEQSNNKRNNRYIEYNGEVKTLSQWADMYNICRMLLRQRLNKCKWSMEKALNTPVRKK